MLDQTQSQAAPAAPLPQLPPIMLMAFDRPALLAQVLDSLLAQQPPLDPKRLHLFQDGHFSRHRDAAVADRLAVDRSVWLFQEAFPEGRVHLAPENLGVAFNFDRAERFAFEELAAPVGYFLEDDLVLSPYYLATLDNLAAMALADERIAYVTAFGDHLAPLEEQHARRGQLQAMSHLWGFALTRRHWLERQPIIGPYLELLRGSDYRDRPHQRIHEYFWGLGVGIQGTSQDGAKGAACSLLGRLRLNTQAALGRYIGAEGLHSTPLLFAGAGYGNTKVYNADAPLSGFVLPATTIQAMLDQQAAEAKNLRGVTRALAALPMFPPQPLPLDAVGLVTLLYHSLLRREPDPQGLAFHAGRLAAGKASAEGLVLSFLACAEFRRTDAANQTAPIP